MGIVNSNEDHFNEVVYFTILTFFTFYNNWILNILTTESAAAVASKQCEFPPSSRFDSGLNEIFVTSAQCAFGISCLTTHSRNDPVFSQILTEPFS